MIVIDGKEIPENLNELLVPSRTAHVIIDMQNDCCHPKGILGRNGIDLSNYPAVIKAIINFSKRSRELGVLQVFVKLISLPHGMSDSPAQIWFRQRLSLQYQGESVNLREPIRYCVKGTWGSEFIEDLEILEGDMVCEKHRSSAFFGTNLDMLLRSNGIQALIFTGCTTEGCLESSVRDAGFLEYFPIVLRDGVGSDMPELHEASLKVMAAYRAEVITVEKALEALQANI